VHDPRWRSVAALLIPWCTFACSDDGGLGGGGGGGSGGAGGVGGGDGGGHALLDPSLFDCTRAADPERSTSVPIACAIDRTCTTRLVSGHRGAVSLAPEDSVAGVRAVIALGADFVETDPRPTKDGYLVNLHDTSVDRTTDGTGEAIDLTLAEIQALTLETFGLAGDFSCERVPTLEQILEAAKGKVHVLVDANKTDRVDLLVAAIQATNTLDWAIFDTSSVEKIEEALTLEPALHTMLRVASPTELADQLAQFVDHPPVIVEYSGDSSVMIPAIHAAGHRALVDVFEIDVVASASGDDLSLYGPLFESGLDIAQSNRPDLVLRYLGRSP
jgi:glycerophosphoryl diester phosphodiesterase